MGNALLRLESLEISSMALKDNEGSRKTLRCPTLWSSTASPLKLPGGLATARLLASLTAQRASVTHRDRGALERLGAPLHLPQRPLTCGHFSGDYGRETEERGGRKGVACGCRVWERAVRMLCP